MEIKIECRICKGEDFVELVRGLEGNPILYFKCTNCGREFKKPEEIKES